jgi:hypothetical protein
LFAAAGEENAMRVEFQTTGGVTFFSRRASPVAIDLGTLNDEDRQRIQQLVQDARFFELPSRLPAPRGADDRTCHITIEDMGRQHTVIVNASFPGPALKELITRLRKIAAG